MMGKAEQSSLTKPKRNSGHDEIGWSELDLSAKRRTYLSGGK